MLKHGVPITLAGLVAVLAVMAFEAERWWVG